MKISTDGWLCIFFSIFIMTVGGCVYGTALEDEITQREKEKTKQIMIQAKVDSLKIMEGYEK